MVPSTEIDTKTSCYIHISTAMSVTWLTSVPVADDQL